MTPRPTALSLLALLATASSLASLAAGQGQAIAVYGNWCGPNFGSGIPVDAVDAACQRHDNCYDSAVSNSAGNKRAENSAKCACDTDLMNEANALKADGATYPLLAEAARTTVDGILTVFKYKCGVVAIYDTFKEAAAQARADREARKAAEAAATAGR